MFAYLLCVNRYKMYVIVNRQRRSFISFLCHLGSLILFAYFYFLNKMTISRCLPFCLLLFDLKVYFCYRSGSQFFLRHNFNEQSCLNCCPKSKYIVCTIQTFVLFISKNQHKKTFVYFIRMVLSILTTKVP